MKRKRQWVIALLVMVVFLCLPGCNAPGGAGGTEGGTDGTPAETEETKEAAMTPIAYEAEKYHFEDLVKANAIKLVGRSMFVGTDLAFDWGGSGFVAIVRTKGETMTVEYDISYNSVISVCVDGEEAVRESVAGKGFSRVPIPEGEHIVSFLKDSNVSIQPEDYSFLKSLRFGGEFLHCPPDQDYYIEIIGDSIAAGCGALGVFTPGVDYSYKDHSARASFGYVAANLLAADYSMVTRGGIGVLKSRDPIGRPMPDCYDYVSPWHDREHLWDFTKRETDLVILELGANDAEFGTEEWVEALDAFVKQIRERNGDVPILWVGKSTRRFEEVKQYVADNKVPDMYVMYYAYGTSGSGSPATAKAGHPNASEQREMGEAVAQFIRDNGLLKQKTCYVEGEQ